MKKYKNKFERNQAYMMHKKNDRLKDLAFKFRNELLDLETPAESIFKSYLIRMRIKFEFQKIIFAGNSFYIVDFFLPRKVTVVEIDGTHHSNMDNLILDEIRTEDLLKSGIKKVYRFGNSEVFNRVVCMNKIKDIVGFPSS